MMDHETWRRNLVSVIRDLADASYREGTCLGAGAGPEVNWMTETICRFFDDYDVDGFLAASTGRPILPPISVKVSRACGTLNDFLEQGPGEDPGDTMRHPKWREIQELAGKALCALSNGSAKQPEPLAHRS